MYKAILKHKRSKAIWYCKTFRSEEKAVLALDSMRSKLINGWNDYKATVEPVNKNNVIPFKRKK